MHMSIVPRMMAVMFFPEVSAARSETREGESISMSVLGLTRQDRTVILGEIPPIFSSFSTDFPPKIVPHPCYIYISAVLVWNIGGKTLAWYPIRHISAQMFTDSACFFLPMFRSFSAYFPPNLQSLWAGPVLQGTWTCETQGKILSLQIVTDHSVFFPPQRKTAGATI